MIPPELRRVVEFLNEQMDPAEVLAIEVKQFIGEEITLVPESWGKLKVLVEEIRNDDYLRQDRSCRIPGTDR